MCLFVAASLQGEIEGPSGSLRGQCVYPALDSVARSAERGEDGEVGNGTASDNKYKYAAQHPDERGHPRFLDCHRSLHLGIRLLVASRRIALGRRSILLLVSGLLISAGLLWVALGRWPI